LKIKEKMKMEMLSGKKLTQKRKKNAGKTEKERQGRRMTEE
jgi:hypothetical protein